MFGVPLEHFAVYHQTGFPSARRCRWEPPNLITRLAPTGDRYIIVFGNIGKRQSLRYREYRAIHIFRRSNPVIYAEVCIGLRLRQLRCPFNPISGRKSHVIQP